MRLHYWQEDAGECRQAAAGKATGTGLRGAPSSGDGGGGRARLPLDWVPAGGGETAGRAREREAQVDVSLFRRDVERSIVVARNFESPSQEDEYGRPPRSYPSSFVHHFLRSVFSRAPLYPQLRDLHLAHG